MLDINSIKYREKHWEHTHFVDMPPVLSRIIQALPQDRHDHLILVAEGDPTHGNSQHPEQSNIPEKNSARSANAR